MLSEPLTHSHEMKKLPIMKDRETDFSVKAPKGQVWMGSVGKENVVSW